MKRFLSVLMVAVILVSAFSINAFAADDELSSMTVTKKYTDEFKQKFLKADINGDGALSTVDASECLRVAAKLDAPKENVNYDLDGDEMITTADARKALRIVSGLDVVVTDEEIFDYFLLEVNSIKQSKPGFKRVATATCKSATITMSGNKFPLTALNVNDMEYNQYLRKNEKLFKLAASDEEFAQMLAEADAIYTPQKQTKVVTKGSSQHFTNYPVSPLATSCRLTFDEIKKITLEQKDGFFFITLTMKNYTYDSKNPYPATSLEDTERQALPYGKVFDLPTFDDTDKYKLEKVILEDGKVTVKIDSTTGEIINSDYFFKYTASMEVIPEEETEVVTKMKQVITLDEAFEMNTATN